MGSLLDTWVTVLPSSIFLSGLVMIWVGPLLPSKNDVLVWASCCLGGSLYYPKDFFRIMPESEAQALHPRFRPPSALPAPRLRHAFAKIDGNHVSASCTNIAASASFS